jgi:hypothetical protein
LSKAEPETIQPGWCQLIIGTISRRSTAIPHLTPDLPPRYRRRALAALARLAARARVNIVSHRATIERLPVDGEEAATARASLSLAERGLALLLGRQHFLSAAKPQRD